MVIRIFMLVLLAAASGCRERSARLESAATVSTPPEPRAVETSSGAIRWLGVGGGSVPSINQVSLEDDLRLARQVFGPSGRVLFAGGEGADGVQVLAASPRGDSLLRDLADLFAPRGGRDARYRVTTLRSIGTATGPNVLKTLRNALSAPTSSPLTVFVSAHGDKGQRASDNAVLLWGGYDLTPTDISKELAAPSVKRQLQLVVTSCFSGGFAEVIFTAADAASGPVPGRVAACGLFAAPWDRESTGCDPHPDRRAHHGYGIHFLNALQRRDRLGASLKERDIDFDGDGRVSLLEAHTRVRLASDTMDLPTTTSERWLRHVAPKPGPEEDPGLVEEQALIFQLSERLATADPAPELARRRAIVERLEGALDAAARAEREAYHDVASELLRRWPVLDDAWHPDFAPTVSNNRATLRAWLDRSAAYARYLRARQRYDAAGVALDTARVKMAPWERFERALETRRLAGRLKALGGSAWERYRGLLACERGLPPTSK